MQSLKERLLQFLFPVETDNWLTTLRVGFGLQITLYSISLRSDWYVLLGGSGVGSRDLAETLLSLESHFVPRLGWFVALGEQLGLPEDSVLAVTWICLFVAGCGLVLGLACRLSAVLAWFLHLCAAGSGDFVSYGVDNFMTIGLFYLMLSPLPDRYSLDWRLRKTRARDPQFLGFWRRVLQLHLCVIYFFSGLTKCLGSGWWNGSAIWRALIRPPFNVIDPQILARGEFVFPIIGIVICLLETGYPFFIWSSKTRNIWLIGICAMHVGIGLTMGMYLFAFIMIVLNLAAFAFLPGRNRAANLSTWRYGNRAHELAGTEHSFRSLPVPAFVWVNAPFTLDHREQGP
ncbi:MAG: HTTM domain-containing protein, partial [Verrucomicrobia bacterium]|nr:HTTM domain-containing protein [Verrucomicrobiota bacterium]